MFSWEYGTDDPKKWCLFKHQLNVVFTRKFCTTLGLMCGVFSLCLYGNTLHDFDMEQSDIADDSTPGFAAIIQNLNQCYFDLDTPNYDQIQLVKSLKKTGKHVLEGVHKFF